MTSSGSLCPSSLLTGKLDTDNSLYALCIASIHTSAKCRLRYLLTTLTVACCWLLYDPHLSPCVLIQFDACHATVHTVVGTKHMVLCRWAFVYIAQLHPLVRPVLQNV